MEEEMNAQKSQTGAAGSLQKGQAPADAAPASEIAVQASGESSKLTSPIRRRG